VAEVQSPSAVEFVVVAEATALLLEAPLLEAHNPLLFRRILKIRLQIASFFLLGLLLLNLEGLAAAHGSLRVPVTCQQTFIPPSPPAILTASKTLAPAEVPDLVL
jgi:hypothetical protein